MQLKPPQERGGFFVGYCFNPDDCGKLGSPHWMHLQMLTNIYKRLQTLINVCKRLYTEFSSFFKLSGIYDISAFIGVLYGPKQLYCIYL